MKKIALIVAAIVCVFGAVKLAFADSNPFGLTGTAANSNPPVGWSFGGGKILSVTKTGNNYTGLIIDSSDIEVAHVVGKMNYTNASNATTLNTAANHKRTYPAVSPATVVGDYTITYSAWRLPTKEELALFKTNKALINTAPGSTNWYWSSTSTAGDAAHVWTHNFANGNTYNYLTYYTCFVRTVRTFTAIKH